MANIADIPSYFLNPPDPDGFLLWLDKTPIPYDIKKELMALFTEFTDYHFNATDYFFVVHSHW